MWHPDVHIVDVHIDLKYKQFSHNDCVKLSANKETFAEALKNPYKYR